MAAERQMDPKSVLEEEVLPKLDEAKQKLEQFDQRLRAFVVEHPFLALGGAVFVGYLVARAAQRR